MSWLRNLQGQLTELANEVLSEATEEVADPESELQVVQKKVAEAEKQLLTEKAKNDLLEKRCADLDQNLMDLHTEMEMGRAKYETMIASRDQELKRLRIENEQLLSNAEEFEHSTPKTSLDNEARDKALLMLGDVQKQLEVLRAQKEDEIAAIMDQHSRTIQELRESYEEKLKNLEASFPASTSQSGISIIGSATIEHPDLSAVHEELENMALIQSGEPQFEVSRREEELQRTVQELTDANQTLATKIEELTNQLSSYESLRRQTAELTRAYNDLNTEYESYKENNGGIAVRNQDLVQRIDTLRANLIEYEERYEQCRREHAETERQLVQLTVDFSKLKDAVDQNSVEEELNRMKSALEVSKNEGSLLKSEVERFRDTVVMFEEELDELRVLNKKQHEENQKLHATIKEILEEKKDLIIRNQLLTEDYEGIAKELEESRNAYDDSNDNKELSTYESAKKERNEILEDKVRILEQIRDSLKERISELESQKSTQEVESLTNQLREALASNSEKTDECEKLRADVEEHKKEIQIRQNCVDDLIVQNNLLQVQYQEAADQVQEQKPIIAEKEKMILKLEQDLAHLQDEHDATRAEMQTSHSVGVGPSTSQALRMVYGLEKIIEEDEEMAVNIQKHHEETISLRNELNTSVERYQQLQNEIKQLQERPDYTEYIGQLQTQNEELRKVATEKHEESVRYYNELQNALTQLHERDQSLATLTSKVASMEETIKNESKLQKELSTLKALLKHLEDSTTIEAIEAEKRETDLRSLVAELQKSHHFVAEGANEQSKILELRVTDLTMRLETAESELKHWKEQAEITEKLMQEKTDALQALQGVLREISSDHEKESATLQHANEELTFRLNELTKSVDELKSEIERLKFEKQAVEDEVDAVQRDIAGRQRIIEELENQLEDLKSAQNLNSSYRIDDMTLRSLFMSYFLAANDKKADIAILLANILQYSKEDVDRITAVLFPNGKSAPKQRNTGPSLTEQFVRFLESESESAKTASSLPVDVRTQAYIAPDIPSSQRVPASSLDELLK